MSSRSLMLTRYCAACRVVKIKLVIQPCLPFRLAGAMWQRARLCSRHPERLEKRGKDQSLLTRQPRRAQAGEKRGEEMEIVENRQKGNPLTFAIACRVTYLLHPNYSLSL